MRSFIAHEWDHQPGIIRIQESALRSALTLTTSFSLLLCLHPCGALAQVSLSAKPVAPQYTPAPAAQPAPVLDRIRAHHSLSCGVAKEEEDYSRAEDHGNRAAFDIDLCKAVAVATLGLNAPLVVRSYPDEPAAIKALKAGEIDLIATASLTVTNSAQGLVFSPPVFFDGQGFLTREAKTVAGLTGKRVCFLTGSIAEYGLHHYAAEHHVTYIWYPFSEAGEMEAAFFTGQCEAITSDISSLMNIRGIDPRRTHEFTLLPDIIRQDPLAMATTTADPRFSAIVHWAVEALLQAEEMAITQANVAQRMASLQQSAGKEPEVAQLLGQRFGTGTLLGLDPYWCAHMLAAEGNYGEIFSRDLGADSPFHLERGENRLGRDGGLMFAEPLTDR